MTHSDSPVEIARQALRRLADLGLPPTPENYESHYRDIAGMEARDSAESDRDQQAEMLEMVRALIQLVTQANDGLHSDLGRFSDESRKIMTQIEINDDPRASAELFKGLAASATWLLNQVEATRRELDLAHEQISQVSQDLERAEALAVTDPLTGVPNRRGLDIAISREISRARRTNSNLCVAVIDIDHFKSVNDQYGHVIGDQALVHLVNVIRPGVRESDVFGRYGGEEFLLLMPDTPLTGAEFTLNRLLRTLQRAPLHTRSGSIAMSFSAGLTQWRAPQNAHETVEQADQAMYAAKQAGRARIQVAEEVKQASDDRSAVQG